MKKVLYVILGLLGLYLVLCLVGPSKVSVSRSTVINASPEMVQKTVADFKTFPQWSPWQEKDPNMSITYSGEMGQPGSKYEWAGNKAVGKGTMEMIAVNGDTVKQKVTFIEPWPGGGDVYFVTKAEGNGTNLTWGMSFPTKFFMRPMMLFMNMDKMVGGEYEKGLAKLKTVIESQATAPTSNYEVKEIDWAERTYCGTKSTNLAVAKISPFFMENFPKIWGDLEKNKIQPQSAPSCMIFKWDDATMSGDMAAVIAVDKNAKVKGWEMYTTPAGKALQVTYYGAYEKIGPAHEAIAKYMKEKNLNQGIVIEEYVTDPGKEKDTSKWLTNIYYTLK